MEKQQNAENYESRHGSNGHDQDFHLHFPGSRRKVIVHFEPFQSLPLFAARLIIQPNSVEVWRSSVKLVQANVTDCKQLFCLLPWLVGGPC